MNNRRLSLTVVFGLLTAALSTGGVCAETRSIVYSSRSDKAIESFKENPPVIRAMVDELVKKVTGKGDVASAWRSLVKPGDKVGIKIATGGGRFLSTHGEVVEAIVAGLAQAGIARRDVIVWDRMDLKTAGIPANAGYQVRGIEPGTGYNQKAEVSSPVIGRLIWGDLGFKDNRKAFGADRDLEQLSSLSHWSNIVSRDVTKIINVPVMINDESCGFAGALYNVTIPNLDNWRRFIQAPNFGNPYISELYSDPNIGPKVVLTLMDGLIAQYAGGPGFKPDYAFHHKTLYASKDPVAIDSIALGQVLQWRNEANLPTRKPCAGYLEAAEAMEIGNCSPDRVELRECQAAP